VNIGYTKGHNSFVMDKNSRDPVQAAISSRRRRR
jgi:hypothetical protein